MIILVAGAKGMLGREFVRQLQACGRDEVVGWGREELDITHETEVMGKIGALKPDAIFNCAAYNNVDKAEDEPEVANAINGEAVGYLARASVACGATLVHFSTDYVFSGQMLAAKKLTIVNNIAEHGYREDETRDPISVYGRSKALGEHRMFSVFRHPERSPKGEVEGSPANVGRWYLIRTSKLFGSAGVGATSKKSFPEIVIKIAKEKGRVEAVDAEAGSPTYVKDLVEATLNLIGSQNYSLSGAAVTHSTSSGSNSGVVEGHPPGIYHITNSGSCTWYEYAKAALEYAGLSNVEVVPVGPDHFPRKARRPAHVILLNTKLPPLRPWQAALKEFLENVN